MGLSLHINEYDWRYMNHTEYVRMSCWLNEVETRVDAVVGDFLPIHSILLLEIRVKARLNVLHYRFPAESICTVRDGRNTWSWAVYLSSLLTKSPKPGVSTTVSRSLTPFSSMSIQCTCEKTRVVEKSVSWTNRR